jgi:hypothetical protein
VVAHNGDEPPKEYSQLWLFFIPTRLWWWNRQCSETSAYKIQTPGNYPGERIQWMTVVYICWFKLLKLTDRLCYGAGVCLLWGRNWHMFSLARRISVFKILSLIFRFVFWRSVTWCMCRALLNSLIVKYGVTGATSWFSIYLPPPPHPPRHLGLGHVFHISHIHMHFSFPALVSQVPLLTQLIKLLSRKKRLCCFSTSHSLVLQFRNKSY